MKKIRCTDMFVNGMFGMAFYDDKATVHTVKCIQKPNCSVLKMTDRDRYIVETSDGSKIEFFRNYCPPHYLECKRAGKRGGSVRNVRVIFYDLGLNGAESVPVVAVREPAPETAQVEVTAASTALVVVATPAQEKPSKRPKPTGQPVETPDVILCHGPEVDFSKPKREDYETKGKYEYAMKKWRKMKQAA